MKAAAWPRPDPHAERLLVVDPLSFRLADHNLGELPGFLRAGDLLVLNDAATLPASLTGILIEPGGAAPHPLDPRSFPPEDEPIEVRLIGPSPDGTWRAALLGAGDWRQRTEDRPAPPLLARGARLLFPRGGAGTMPLRAMVVEVSAVSPRLVRLRFDRDGDALWSALYRVGRAVQYSYVRGPLALWHVQTAYATRPWAVEPPSAGRPLTWRLLLAARSRGVALASVTHAAGLSSTGAPDLDAALPLAERFEVPAETVTAVAHARAAGGRVVAVGTSVVRALEGAAPGGRLLAGAGTTNLRVGASSRLHVVDGLLTGVHQPGESHYELLRALVPGALLGRALDHAEEAGYLAHEFGDSCLILAGSLSASSEPVESDGARARGRDRAAARGTLMERAW